MKKRVLAVLLALALAAALLPVAALAVDPTLQSQIDDAPSGGAIITLNKDYTESITISKGKTITLNLGACTLTNTAGQHTITVQEGATLIINGSGTVDNDSHAKAALYNKGAVTINSGTFTRSQEVQITEENPTNTNSWYLVENGGTLIINGGRFYTGTLNALGNQSSLIRNGASAEIGTPNTVTAKGTLTITGGVFTTAANVIKN